MNGNNYGNNYGLELGQGPMNNGGLPFGSPMQENTPQEVANEPLSAYEVAIEFLQLVQVASLSAVITVIARLSPQLAPICLVIGVLTLLGLALFAFVRKGDQSTQITLTVGAIAFGAMARSWDAFGRMVGDLEASDSWHKEGLIVVSLVFAAAVVWDRYSRHREGKKKAQQPAEQPYYRIPFN